MRYGGQDEFEGDSLSYKKGMEILGKHWNDYVTGEGNNIDE